MPKSNFGTFLVIPEVETKAIRLAEFLKEGKETPRVLLILDNNQQPFPAAGRRPMGCR